nr:MAG TPA: LONG TAIL FIBER PROTEIN P37 PROTEIN, FIBER PROTEIN.2A [Caudoviricetes sp.]
MKDRQPTKVLSNGAIRYGIYNADGSLDHYEYMKREDAPTVEGTPLNKINLLSDNTARKIWPDPATRPSDPTVSQALAELRKGIFSIGDVLVTARAKPSNAWLLCDGQKITREDYPELFNLLRSTAAPSDWTNQTVTGVDRETSRLRYVNGQWMCFNTSTDDRWYVYTSKDTHTWTQHIIHYEMPDYTAGTALDVLNICYSSADNVYYLYLQWINHTSRSSYSYIYKLDTALTTLTKLITLTIGSTEFVYNRGYWYNSWERPNGSVCFAEIAYGANPWVSNSTYKYFTTGSGRTVTNHGMTNTYAGACDGIDYNFNSDQFLIMVGRKAYTNNQPGYSDTATLVGEIPTSILSEDAASHGFIPFVCAATNTIIVVWGNGRLYYAYSTDKGATWTAGPSQIQNNVSPSLYGYDYLEPWNGWTFVNGLLIFQATLEEQNSRTTHDYTCSISDPADKVYKDQGSYIVQLNSDALAITAPQFDSNSQTASIFVRNYNNSAKAVPTITPDSRSHAYIKALEE